MLNKSVSFLISAMCVTNAFASDYVVDATTMNVGSSIGENLVVKEGCLDPSKTTCAEKFKWLTSSSAVKMGNLQILGELKGNFEIIITLDSNDDQKAIKLLTSDNRGISFNLPYGDADWRLIANGFGTGGGNYGRAGWNYGYAFNEVKLVVQQGATESIAQAYINGTPYTSGSGIVKLDREVVFTRVAFEGFTVNDRISDIKIRNISNPTTTACSNGSSTTTTPVSGTTNTGDLPQIASNLDIKIPRGLYSQSGGLFTPAGSIPIWADLKYVPQNGQQLWTLTGAGVLPQ